MTLRVCKVCITVQSEDTMKNRLKVHLYTLLYNAIVTKNHLLGRNRSCPSLN